MLGDDVESTCYFYNTPEFNALEMCAACGGGFKYRMHCQGDENATFEAYNGDAYTCGNYDYDDWGSKYGYGSFCGASDV